MRLPDLRRMPPGDRGPALRIAAFRALTDLDAIEREPRQPGRDAAMARARRIAVRRTGLRKMLAEAARYGLTLPPIVAQRADPNRKALHMTSEPKSVALGQSILEAMRVAIEGGMSPQEAVDTGLMAVGSISIQTEGEYRTGGKFIILGEGLVDGSPEGAATRPQARN